ncbi:MAG: SRPBCC family protein [Akkermansiaceae bacterium]
MPKFTVSKQKIISAPLGQIYDEVRDFNSWRRWAPWLTVEPDCALTYSPSGDSYGWAGQVIGSGKMTVTAEEKNKWIVYDLEFFKPWKPKAKVRMNFREVSDGVEVTWTMDSSLRFFMFWMVGMMEGLIGMDYDRGLAMLKDQIELGEVSSKLEFSGEKQIAGFRYLGKERECPIADIGKTVEADIAKLENTVEKFGIKSMGKPFAVYHKWDLKKKVARFTIGLPIGNSSTSYPEGVFSADMPPVSVYPIRHTGLYRHVGNAWAAGISHGRAKKFKQSRKAHPFEIYEQQAEEGVESVTLVCFPKK